MNCVAPKRIKIFVLNLLLLIHILPATAAAPEIRCDSIVMTFVDGIWPPPETEDDEEFENMGYFQCDLYLSGSNSRSDSLEFTTTMLAFMRPMTVVVEREETSTSCTLTAPTAQTLKQTWKVALTDTGRFEARLDYGVSSAACYFYPSFQLSNYPYIFILDSNFGNWIPSWEEVDYSACKITTSCDDPDKYTVFHSWTHTGREQPRFNVTVLNTEHYRPRYFGRNGLDIAVYHTPERSPAALEPLEKLAGFGNFGYDGTIPVILADWHGEIDGKNYAVGFGYDGYVLCDPSFMDDGSIVHELLHILFPVTCDEGKGRYFVSESVIEWMARYILYGELRRTDDYRLPAGSVTPLYELSENDKDGWDRIYSQGPQYLQELAAQAGADRLFGLITAYYGEQEIIGYEDFIRYLRENLGECADAMDYKIRN